jgi:hypothetical protein
LVLILFVKWESGRIFSVVNLVLNPRTLWIFSWVASIW